MDKARLAWLVGGLVLTYQAAAGYFGLPPIPEELLALLAWLGLYAPVREAAQLKRANAALRQEGEGWRRAFYQRESFRQKDK